ncbi:antibiotic biosynthesis monooxygenase [Marinosulfonomonas sp. PRT-SC04]|nr:antibiotic biosynthesis monooxygenase [Marinosulfonomonas sp. PRT-SC04]
MLSQTKISLTGYIDVPVSRLAEVEAALPEHIHLTRLEPGCLSFDVTLDPVHKGRFQVAELFASRADFDQHQKRAQSSNWMRVTQGIPRRYSISEVD